MDYNNNSSSADKLINLIRAIIKDELKSKDDTVVCKIASVNSDNTYNVFIEPDTQTVIHNIPALSNLGSLNTGDYVYVYKIKNQMNNSFILKKV